MQLIFKVESLSLLSRTTFCQPLSLTEGENIVEITPDGAAFLNGMPVKVELREPACEFGDLQLPPMGIPWSIGRPAPTVPYPPLRGLRRLLPRWVDEAICCWLERDQVRQVMLERSGSISTTVFEPEER